ncbi:hypothetical protein BBD42_16290 [Paenibacillus sp. BIHB 4019]|uniref:DUF3899 domain-containing protein n=1 Tax=Paenibacillus sp. BIHB 4019 TaxID=1870819 RepID=A0A1B2DJI0_9BACL|nr:hypothetical protein [Paenibacillus sp. BIHB 4019]ANY67858.1 hypothetical protein BBD42_16290 [Paenibacillus sp. BIHB 4019]
MKPNHNKASSYIGIAGIVLVIIFVVFIYAPDLGYINDNTFFYINFLLLIIIFLWSLVSLVSLVRTSVKLRILQANYEDKEINEDYFIYNTKLLRTGIRMNTIFLIMVVIGIFFIVKLFIQVASST